MITQLNRGLRTYARKSISISLTSLVLAACSILNFTKAQPYENLRLLNGFRAEVYFSMGADHKARRMAAQLDRVMAFYQKQIQFVPTVKLLILSPQDWKTYSNMPVYGMPHYTNKKTLIVASEDNDFWKSFIPPLDKLTNEQAQSVRKAYTDNSGALTMEPFFDLLAIHELGHAYHQQDSLVMQRRWLSELFVNIFLHSYVADNEPGLLPALTIFPRMVVSTTNQSTLKYTTLKDLDSNYNEIGQKYPRNYGWYQCRWHVAAGDIYDKGGLPAFKKLWQALKSQKQVLDDPSLIDLFTERVHSSIADVPLKWDNYN
jgi:hypothetical protein